MLVIVQMRVQSAVNVYCVNVVFFLLCEAHAVIRPQPHTPAAFATEVVSFTLAGFLLPLWILFLIEVQARQRFLAASQIIDPDALGQYWAEYIAFRVSD